MMPVENYERWQFSGDPINVESSMVKSMRYDAAEQLLEMVFKNGRIYQFVHVPPEIYEHLAASQSKGHYFLAHIRGAYPYWRLHRARPHQAKP